MSDGPVIYDPATDTMLVELRPWPGGPDDPRAGGQDAGDDLVIHYAPDGRPWAWEIEHASRHPELVGDALRTMRAASRCGRCGLTIRPAGSTTSPG